MRRQTRCRGRDSDVITTLSLQLACRLNVFYKQRLESVETTTCRQCPANEVAFAVFTFWVFPRVLARAHPMVSGNEVTAAL